MRAVQALDSLAEAMAQHLVAFLSDRVGIEGREWVDALNAEMHELQGGSRKLRWALGGISLAWTLKRRRVMSLATSRSPVFDVRSVIHANILLFGIVGSAVVFRPDAMLSGFGIPRSSPWAVYGVIRMFAVFALILSVLLWNAREWLVSPAGRGAVRGLCASYAIGTLLIFSQEWGVWDGRSGVLLTLGSLLLALSYAQAGWRSSVELAPPETGPPGLVA
jgi:hypothetical protein